MNGKVQLTKDQSYDMYDSNSESQPTGNIPDGRLLLDVRTAIWYVRYKGTWFQQ